MNHQSSGPPNPRQARYRAMPVHGSGSPVTVILIVISCMVAAVSHLGEKSDPVGWMYFSNQPPQKRVESLYQKLEEMEAAGTTESADYEQVFEEYEDVIHSAEAPFTQIQRGQIWRLFTPMFLHFGIFHLLFNMMWLWTLGRPLEFMLRRGRYVLVVLLVSLFSNLAEALVSGGTNFGGMSGVVYGLFGFVVVHAKLDPMGGIHLNPSTVRYMLIWLVICFTGFLGPIANWAHAFGLVSGGLLGAGQALQNGGWKAIRRRHEFRRAIVSGSGSIHHCEVCGKTERHDPDQHFRVGEDGNEYCEEHLPATGAQSTGF